MGSSSFIVGDWGTSNLRLTLCDSVGAVLATLGGPGAAASRGRFEQVYLELTAPWRRSHGECPALLSGMVGSDIGWHPAGYLPCPVRPQAIASGCVEITGLPVAIVPGLKCRNPLGAPDVMRGEETQILGALDLFAPLRSGRHLLCLPGTHTKWVRIDDGVVCDFLSAPTGELYRLLREHSILALGASDVESAAGPGAFLQGLGERHEGNPASILHRLFECRARVLAGELDATLTGAFLSGLLIGSDIDGALGLLAGPERPPVVHLIGDPQLTARFATGLETRGVSAAPLDGAAASLAGLIKLHSLRATGNPHESA